LHIIFSFFHHLLTAKVTWNRSLLEIQGYFIVEGHDEQIHHSTIQIGAFHLMSSLFDVSFLYSNAVLKLYVVLMLW